MPRFYLPPERWDAPCLLDDEARHCAQVHRCGPGDRIQLIDGQGRTATAEIVTASKHEIALRLHEVRQHSAPARHITLCVAITKGESFDWTLEKAVELGVQSIQPLLTERVIVRLSSEDAAKKQAKWQRAVLEACKQCGQPWLPVVHAPCSLDAALSRISSDTLRLCAALTSDAMQLQPSVISERSAYLVGPEGDFSPAEYECIRTAGWHLWSLGDLTLRSETAAIFGVSLLRSSHAFAQI
jgi:16S rRNA (uracil1498-N3)-methyltransferase